MLPVPDVATRVVVLINVPPASVIAPFKLAVKVTDVVLPLPTLASIAMPALLPVAPTRAIVLPLRPPATVMSLALTSLNVLPALFPADDASRVTPLVLVSLRKTLALVEFAVMVEAFVLRLLPGVAFTPMLPLTAEMTRVGVVTVPVMELVLLVKLGALNWN